MVSNSNEVPNSNTPTTPEQIVGSILTAAFGLMAQPIVAQILPTLDLSLFDESKRAAQQAEFEQTTAELKRLRETIETERGVLESMRQTTLSNNASIAYMPTTANTYADIANLGFDRQAALILSTSQASDINFIADATGHSIGKKPQIYRAACLRLQREIAQGNLDRAIVSLKDESTPVTEKATLIQTIEQFKSTLVEIDEKIDRLLVTLG